MTTRVRRRRRVQFLPGKLTYADYAKLPDDGQRYQILDGKLDVSPSPVPKHQIVSHNLEFILTLGLERRGLGRILDAPIDVILDRHNIVVPDIIFIRKERLDIIGPKNIKGPPDLVVEILSPSSRRTDLTRKSEIYARLGVENYWIVDPVGEWIDFLRLEGGRYVREAKLERPAVARPKAFPGLKIPLDEVFGS